MSTFTGAAIAATALFAVVYRALTTTTSAEIIPDQYIITLSDALAERDVHSHVQWATGVHSRRSAAPGSIATTGLRHTYTGHLNGYAGHFDSATIEEIRAHPDVVRIERDQPVHIKTVRHEKRETIVQTVDLNAPDAVFPWGLEGISHRKFTQKYEYPYDSRAGNGTYAYVIDTGVRSTHADIKG